MVILKTFLRKDDGVTAIEYGLIAGLISLSVIVGAGVIGLTLAKIFNSIVPFIKY